MSYAFPALKAKNPVPKVGANFNGGRIPSMYSIDDTAALCDCIMLNSMYDIFLVDNILGHRRGNTTVTPQRPQHRGSRLCTDRLVHSWCQPSVSLVSITLGPGHPARFVDRGGESPVQARRILA